MNIFHSYAIWLTVGFSILTKTNHAICGSVLELSHVVILQLTPNHTFFNPCVDLAAFCGEIVSVPPDGVGPFPKAFPALATSCRWFRAYQVDHFDLPSLRYEPEMAKKYRKIVGRFTILPAVQPNMVEITKVILLAWWWQKTVLHFGSSSQSYEVSKIGVQLLEAKVPYFEANLGEGSRFCPLRGQKRSK